MNPDTIVMTNGKGCTKAFTGSTRPKEVYVLRSDKDLEDSWMEQNVYNCR